MISEHSLDAVERAKRIKLLVLDVDGVLTNGLMFFGQDGEVLKAFHVQDGMGISLAHSCGMQTAIITGRTSEIVKRRGEELKIGDIYQGAADKVAAMQQLIEKYNLDLTQICYVGDDINDLPLLMNVGLAATVADAVTDVKAVAQVIASRNGGEGAVRQIIEMILQAQGKWEQALEAYRRPGCIGLCQ